MGQKLTSRERPLRAAGSTDRCNTFCELLSWGLVEQGLSRPFIELPRDGTELGLAMQGQIGATRKIGAAICWCFRLTRAARDSEGHKNRLDLGGQCQALMVGKLLASVPSQRPVKFAGQSLRLLD